MKMWPVPPQFHAVKQMSRLANDSDLSPAFSPFDCLVPLSHNVDFQLANVEKVHIVSALGFCACAVLLRKLCSFLGLSLCVPCAIWIHEQSQGCKRVISFLSSLSGERAPKPLVFPTKILSDEPSCIHSWDFFPSIFYSL